MFNERIWFDLVKRRSRYGLPNWRCHWKKKHHHQSSLIFVCKQFFLLTNKKSLHMSNIHSISTILTNQFSKILFEKNGSFSFNGQYAKMLTMCRQWACRVNYTSSMLEETGLSWDSLHCSTKELCNCVPNFVPNNNTVNF
jgi:hypothetical protein